MEEHRDTIRLKHYSYRTERTYVGWIKCYIYFHDVCHPSEMGAPEVKAFLTHRYPQVNSHSHANEYAGTNWTLMSPSRDWCWC